MADNRLHQIIRRFAATLRENVQADAELVERFIRERDELAFESILRNHGRMVLGVCRRVLGNEQDAEDAFQAVFLVLARRARSLREPGRLGNWLFGVAYRTASSVKKAGTKRRNRETAAAARPVEVGDADAELREVLDHEIARLPAKYQEIIVLCDLEGLSGKKVAEQLGCPEGTVKSRLSRARAMLAKRLTRHGLAAGLASLVVEQAGTAGLPVSLIQSTTKAAVTCAAGKISLAGIVTAEVATLTEGVLKTMFIVKMKAVVAGMLVVAGLSAGTGWIYYHQAGAAQPAARQSPPKGNAGPEARAVAADAVPKQDAKLPSPEAMRVVVATWEKAGAVFGWVKTQEPNGTGNEFVPAKQDLAVRPKDNSPFSGDDVERGYFATVQFLDFPRGKLGTLPMRERCLRLWLSPVTAPFGGAPGGAGGLQGGSVTDDDLKEVAQLKHLQWLGVYRAKLTDAGLKHLASLQEMQRLALPFHAEITGAGMKELARLKYLKSLNLALTQVTDVGMKELAKLVKLEHLNLAGTPVTDAGLKELAGLKSLQTLYLGGTQVTDAGLKDAARLTTLRRLGLSGTQVSDTGLKQLTGMKNLRNLNLRGTQATDAGVKELRESLPQCNISR